MRLRNESAATSLFSSNMNEIEPRRVFVCLHLSIFVTCQPFAIRLKAGQFTQRITQSYEKTEVSNSGYSVNEMSQMP